MKKRRSFKCDLCPSSSTTAAHLQAHKATVHSEARPFQCEYCDYKAKLKTGLRAHYSTHFPEIYKTQSCPQCPYKCLNPGELRTHLRFHTKEKPHACRMCSFRATTRSGLTAHMRYHTGEKPYKCPMCNSLFTQLGNMKQHLLHVHNKSSVYRIPCSFPGCARKFRERGTLKRHLSYFHNKETRFSCPYCQKVFYNKTGWDIHIRRYHTKEKRYKCGLCEYTAVTSAEVKQHESQIHGVYEALECPLCDVKLKNKKSLALHEIRAHRAGSSKEAARKWKCEASGCNKEYNTKYVLRDHVNSIHLQLRPFKCPYCDYSAAKSTGLKGHLRVHTGEKPYSCNLCQQSFATCTTLTFHKAYIHSGLRPFRCDLCEYSGKSKTTLASHKRVHETTLARFDCTICKVSGQSDSSKGAVFYSFRYKSSLVQHLRRRHSKHESSSPKYGRGQHAAEISLDLVNTTRNVHNKKRLPPLELPSCSRALRTRRQSYLIKRGSSSATTSNDKIPIPIGAEDIKGSCKPCSVPLLRVKELSDLLSSSCFGIFA